MGFPKKKPINFHAFHALHDFDYKRPLNKAVSDSFFAQIFIFNCVFGFKVTLNGMLCLLDIYYDYGTRNFYIDPFDGNRSKLTGKRINEYNCDVTLSAYGWFYSIYGDPLWS